MASSRTALSQLVSPDRRLAWSLTAAARRREWERARVLRSWQAAQRAQQRTARRSARAAPRSAVLGATFLAMAVPAGGSTREVCAGLGAFFGTRAVVALASLRSARQRAGGPPVPALPPPLPLPPPVQSAHRREGGRLHRRGERQRWRQRRDRRATRALPGGAQRRQRDDRPGAEKGTESGADLPGRAAGRHRHGQKRCSKDGGARRGASGPPSCPL